MRATEIEYIGKSCELKSLMNDLLAIGLIKNMDEVEGTMDIVPQPGEFLSTLPYNQPVKLVLNLPRIGFRLMLGRVYLSSGSMLRLVDIGTHQTEERRQFFRLNIGMTGLITLLDADKDAAATAPAQAPETMEVEIKDISLGGVRIATRRIFAPGEQFTIAYTLINNKAEMMCTVCREIFMEAQRPGIHQYGCQFINVTDRALDKLCADLFELQRVQVRKKKEKSF